MALIRRNSKSRFEEAKRLLTEPFACYRLITSSIHIILPPKCLGNTRSGIIDQLDSMLCLYNARLNGMLVAYGDVHIQQPLGAILACQPYVHFDIIAEFVVFQPEPGSVLKAVVTRTAQMKIGCLIHGFFNASLNLKFYNESSDRRKDFEVGDEVIIEVEKVSTTKDGLISIDAKPANPQLLHSIQSKKRSRADMESVDSGFEHISPPMKKPKSVHDDPGSSATPGPSATSTPYPMSQRGLRDNDTADTSFTFEDSDSSNKKHKKKKGKDKDRVGATTAEQDDVIDSGTVKKKKKKKDKDIDPDKTLSMDSSVDALQLSVSDTSAFCSSAAESITDTEKKRRKEKRKSAKVSAANVVDTSVISLEMSDGSSSGATVDSGQTHILGSSGKKKKHKKNDSDS